MAAIDTKAIGDQIANLAKSTFQENADAAIQGGTTLLENNAAKLQQYADQYAAKEIDDDDLSDLKAELIGLATMDALEAKGVGQEQVAHYVDQVAGILISAVITAAVHAL